MSRCLDSTVKYFHAVVYETHTPAWLSTVMTCVCVIFSISIYTRLFVAQDGEEKL